MREENQERVEKIEKTIDFILEQQAKFSVDIDLLKESLKQGLIFRGEN